MSKRSVRSTARGEVRKFEPCSRPPQRGKPTMLTRRHLLAASTAGLLSPGLSFVPRALAQAIKKPAHMIVGFPAGGGTDVIARILADGLRGPYAPTPRRASRSNT